MDMKRADLHTHTTASDGMCTPERNVELAKEAGLAAIAITDHDTVAGIEAAMSAGERLGVLVVPGVEISTAARGQDIHILGYFIRHEDAALRKRLAELRSVRDRRNEAILVKLAELGIPMTMEEVAEKAAGGGRGDDSIGRPHIADALVARGYAKDLRDAFDRYLGTGCSAYVAAERIKPQTAIDWIHEAGGKAIVAHPGLYGMDDLVEELLSYGADGIEACHSDHSPEEERRYAEMADRFGRIATAGSDFHGERQGEVFHGPIGGRSVSLEVVERLRNQKVV